MMRFSGLVFGFFMVLAVSVIAQAEPMGEISSAETRSGEITDITELDTFTFVGSTGQRAIIRLSTSGMSPDLRLYYGEPDYDLPPLSREQNGNSGASVEMEGILQQSGLYTIVVNDSNHNEIGDYWLSLLLIPGSTVSDEDPDGGDIRSDETKTGTMSCSADTDVYTFTGQENEGVIIALCTSGCSPELRLYYGENDPGGLPLGYGSNQNVGACVEINQALPVSGAYAIVVADSLGNQAGSYYLSFTKVPGTQWSPSVRINLNQNAFTPGETLEVSAHVVNGPNPQTVEAKRWIVVPPDIEGNRRIISNGDPLLIFNVPADAANVYPLFSHTFSQSDDPGEYQFGARFLHPKTGREISVSAETFTFSSP